MLTPMTFYQKRQAEKQKQTFVGVEKKEEKPFVLIPLKEESDGTTRESFEQINRR